MKRLKFESVQKLGLPIALLDCDIDMRFNLDRLGIECDNGQMYVKVLENRDMEYVIIDEKGDDMSDVCIVMRRPEGIL